MKKDLPKTKINLLPPELREVRGLHFFGAVATRASFAILGVYLILLLILFLGIFFLSRQLADLQNIKSSLVEDIGTLRSREGLLMSVRNRATLSKAIYQQTAVLPSENIDKALSLVPSDANLRDLSTKEGGPVILGVRAPTSASVVNLFANLKSKQQFSTAILNSFSLNDRGVYTLSLEIK